MFLRLIAGLLAATGLLGHGLAMLLVGLLVSPAAAGPDSRYFGEICTPDGVVSLAVLGTGDSGHGEGRHGDPLNGCPVCTAYAQIGAADLPVAFVAPILECCGATHRSSPFDGVPVSFLSDAQPRAPPTVV